MKCCRPPSFSSTIMGRSWADHGQIMGRPWAIDSCRKILKISAFSDTVFSRKILQICDFRTRLEQSVKLFLQTPLSTCFLGKNCLFSESKINFTHWNRVLLSERSILHLENAMFSKIRPYFLRTFWLSAIKRAHANMRSLNNGWQPARPSKRTCVLLMAGNQHVSNCEHAFS